MQINAISETAASSNQWTSAQSQSNPAVASLSTDSRQSAPAAQSSDSSGAASSFALIQNSASNVDTATIAASYSTTVGGRNYSASVAKSGGVYTASVPMPPGVSASGSSIESAELNLSIILDTLA
jgi:hypothetical protein